MSAANTQNDAHMSLRRWAALILGNTLAGNPWTVVTQEQAVPDERRPVAVVAPATELTVLFARQTSVAGDVRVQQGLVVTAYTEMTDSDGAALSTRAARRRATEVSDLLMNGLLIGLEDDDGSALCGPMDIPIYDYDGVAVEGPERGPGPNRPYGMMEALSSSSEPIPDPDDDRRWTVVLNLRLAWWRAGRARAGGPPPRRTSSMPGTWTGP